MRKHREALPALRRRCRFGGRRASAHVRLPTETEWEYAARGAQVVDRRALEARLFPRREGNASEDGPLRDWAYTQVAGGSGADGAARADRHRSARNPVGLVRDRQRRRDGARSLPAGARRQPAAAAPAASVKGGNYLEGEQTLFTGMRRGTRCSTTRASRAATRRRASTIAPARWPLRAAMTNCSPAGEAEGASEQPDHELPPDADTGVSSFTSSPTCSATCRPRPSAASSARSANSSARWH